LIVEDDPHFGGQLRDLFEFQGYDVELLSSGENVLEVFAQRPPSAVIIDIVLPGPSGVEVAKTLRNTREGRNTPIFMMSAVYRDPRLFERELRSLGVVEFLAKPFAPIDLGRKVDALLDGGDELGEATPKVTNTGSWRLEELQEALGEGPTQLGSQQGFDRRGLLETFVALFRRHAVGCLTLSRGEDRRDIYFLNGYPVSVDSTLESESLEAVLAEMGLIDEASLAAAVRAARLEGQEVREVVLGRRLLKERKLRRVERARLQRVVVSSFDWPSGSLHFHPGQDQLRGRSVVEVNPVTCLADAVRQSLTLSELRPDLDPRMDHAVARGPLYSSLVSYLPLPPGLSGLLDCLESGETISSLFARFPAEKEALIRTLWLMINLGIVETEAQGAAASPDSPRDFSFVADHHRFRLDLDYYGFLGVERDAPAGDIESAWSLLDERYRPTASDPLIEEQLRDLRTRLRVSFKTLSDEAERERYDNRLAALETGEWTWPLSGEST